MNEEPIKVLLVEDNPADADIVREFLDEAIAVQFELVHVDKFADALQQLAEERFDIILLDLSLPDEGGIAVITQAIAAAPLVPIVVLTGRADDELAIAALRAGAQDYFLKMQMNPDALARTMRYAIERNRWKEILKVQEGIHQPLGLIVGELGLLLDEVAPDDPHRDRFQSVRQAANQIKEIVDRLNEL